MAMRICYVDKGKSEIMVKEAIDTSNGKLGVMTEIVIMLSCRQRLIHFIWYAIAIMEAKLRFQQTYPPI